MAKHFLSQFTQLFTIFVLTLGYEETPTPRPIEATTEAHLFTRLGLGTSEYVKAVRPVKRADKPVTVQLGMTLTDILDLDAGMGVLTTNTWLDIQWTDEFLTWDPKEFGGIVQLSVPSKYVWTPDVILYNNADDHSSAPMPSTNVVLNNRGSIHWIPAITLRSTCKVDLTYFPFDQQYCILKFGSWTHHGGHLNLTAQSSGVDLSIYTQNNEFRLLNVTHKRNAIKYDCCPSPYYDVQFRFHFQRRPAYHVYTILFPSILILWLNLSVFWLPAGSNQKIVLNGSILVAFFVLFSTAWSHIPATSRSIPLIVRYLLLVLILTSICLTLSVATAYINSKGSFLRPIPQLARKLILGILAKLLCVGIPFDSSGKATSSRFRRSGQFGALMAGEEDTALSFSSKRDSNAMLINPKLQVQDEGDPAHSIHKDHSSTNARTTDDVINAWLFHEQRKGVEKNSQKEWASIAMVLDRLFFCIVFGISLFATLVLCFMMPS